MKTVIVLKLLGIFFFFFLFLHFDLIVMYCLLQGVWKSKGNTRQGVLKKKQTSN